MRTWFNQHPNVPLVFWAVACLVNALAAVDYWTEQDWGWAIFHTVATLGCAMSVAKWWERT